MKKLLCLVIPLLLLFSAFSCRAEEGQRVYVLGNFYFGMPISEVKALDRGNAALTDTDTERGFQQMTLISDNFVVTLWFWGLEEDAPLEEMDFAFYMPPDSLAMRDNRLQIQTGKLTVNTVYAYVERLCRQVFGNGRDAGALPFSSLLFSGGNREVSLTRMRIYTQPDGQKTDVIVHLVANGEDSVNYLICRQTE